MSLENEEQDQEPHCLNTALMRVIVWLREAESQTDPEKQQTAIASAHISALVAIGLITGESPDDIWDRADKWRLLPDPDLE